MMKFGDVKKFQKNDIIFLRDDKHNKIAKWMIVNAKTNEVIMEHLELVHYGILRE